SNPPAGTVEFALVVDDPDAPSPEPWVHWVIYNIPARVTGVAEGVHPKDRPPSPEGAAQGVNSWGTLGYRGPAPPKGHGVHHSHFTVFALDVRLGLAAGLDKRGLLKAVAGHVLGKGELVGTYERKK